MSERSALPRNRDRALATGIAIEPVPTPTERLAAHEPTAEDALTLEDRRAAEILVRHLFAHEGHHIDGIEYAVTYRLAAGHVGGDIVDVYHFDNGSVAFAIADVSGKGAQAAVHAALIKFGLRCYASEGLTPQRTLRSLDRIFIENKAFERTEQFASVFFAVLDDRRRSLTYASAGHEPVVLLAPGAAPYVLPPTAPLVGVFDDQHHLFRQQQIAIEPGTMLFGATDGITEARSPDGEFFGMDGMIDAVVANAGAPIAEQLHRLLATAERFANGRFHDDIAAFALRIV
ncbi:MAG: hypothetical protein NVS2B3_00550 [Vulcanimicrobiaceae bacterium]